jgi:hypothetical protein
MAQEKAEHKKSLEEAAAAERARLDAEAAAERSRLLAGMTAQIGELLEAAKQARGAAVMKASKKERKKEGNTYARCQACIEAALCKAGATGGGAAVRAAAVRAGLRAPPGERAA